MNAKFYLLSLLMLLVFSNAFAQKDESTLPKTFDAAVINGKATNLARPAFPASARAVRASGSVYVQVTIDEEGKVISAEAVAGHPLLRAAAVQAARASTFLPTTLSGNPVKVTGIIVYNFVLPMSFLQIGYEISFAEKSASLTNNFPAANISGNIPADWEEEKNDLSLIAKYLFQEIVKARKTEETASNKNLEQKKLKTENYNAAINTPPTKTISDPIVTLKELRLKIDNRLKNDELKAWYFKLGQILGKINAEIENPDKTLSNVDELNKFLVNISSNVPEMVVSKARAITEFSRSPVSDSERRQQLAALVRNLRDSSI